MMFIFRVYMFYCIIACFFTMNIEAYAASHIKKQIPEALQKKVIETVQNKCALCHSSNPMISQYASKSALKETVETKFKQARRLDLEKLFIQPLQNGQPVTVALLANIKRVLESDRMPPGAFISIYKEVALTAEEKKVLLEWIDMYKSIKYSNES